ncbi:MAG: response regulator, partial [Gammaproteobacteria bacterium]|nr:response regulator [Gammaproteobacteria bacterium]
RNQPVICLSASAQAEDVANILANGFDYHVAKPIDFDQLYTIIETILSSKLSGVSSESEKTDAPGNETVNWSLALYNYADDPALLARLLKEFFNHYTTISDDLDKLLISGDLHEAQRISHNIKGLSGSFGATRFQEAARNLEDDIKKNLGNHMALAKVFRKEHELFMQAARAHLEHLHSL